MYESPLHDGRQGIQKHDHLHFLRATDSQAHCISTAMALPLTHIIYNVSYFRFLGASSLHEWLSADPLFTTAKHDRLGTSDFG
jgi:hypothetical protein